MTKSKVLLVALLLSLTLSEIAVCDGQYIEIMKGIGTIIQIALKAKDQLGPLLNKYNQTVDEHAIQNQKLDGIAMKIDSMEKVMMSNFKKLLKEIEEIPGETVTQYTASKFERYMQTIDKTLENLVYKKAQVNRGELTLDSHFRHDVDNYKTELDKYKNKIEVIMQGKEISVDFLAQVKNKTDVCKDKMTQLQLLDSFRALYVDTISRYLMARHIIISLWETADKTSHADKKRELNSYVRRDLLIYANRFQQLMTGASREFQLCDKPSSEYIIHSTAKRSRYCFMTGEGSQSDQIVSHEAHFGNANKACWDYLSLAPVNARPGYVVVGVKIERNVNVLYVKIIEGKLLPNGIIDPKSIAYNAGPAPGIGQRVVKLDYRQTMIDLTETTAPGDRVVTGLRFALTDDKHIYLQVQSTELNLNKGLLIDNTSRMEPHNKGSTQFQVRQHAERDNEVIRNDVGLQPVKPNQYLRFEIGGKLQAHPYFDLSDVYPTPIVLLSGASLYVRQVKGTQGYLSIRLHSFDIVPHVAKIEFNLNEDFADVLKDI